MAGKRSETNEFHMNLRSGRRRSSIPFLPEELIFKILVLLPAHVLHDVARLVCRAWHAIVQDPRFVAAHWSLSPNTFLVHTHEVTPAGHFSCYNPLDVTECDLKLTDFRFRTRKEVRFLSSCNGLILSRAPRGYYVGNPITRTILRLPEIPSYMIWVDDSLATLAFEASSKVYKVVIAFQDNRSCLHGLAIFTVGVDKTWRPLIFTQLEKPIHLFSRGRISVPGFIYYDSDSTTSIYGWDIESETIKSITIPYVCHHPWEKYIRQKGDSISLWHHNPDFSMEVWVLKDYKTEEWVKFLYIAGESVRNASENFWLRNKLKTTTRNAYLLFAAESWLGNDEKILFNIDRFGVVDYSHGMIINPYTSGGLYILYDLNTHACTEVMESEEFCRFIPFINTLVWV